MNTPGSLNKNRILQAGLIFLFGFIFFIESFAAALFASLQFERSPILAILFPITVGTSLVLWVKNDLSSTGASLGLDQGLIIFIAWPIIFPVYLLHSRGLRSGCVVIFAFFGLIIIPTFVGIVIGFLIGSLL